MSTFTPAYTQIASGLRFPGGPVAIPNGCSVPGETSVACSGCELYALGKTQRSSAPILLPYDPEKTQQGSPLGRLA